MPEISRFLGIVIAMFYNDHEPPHFHAIYRDSEALIDISTGGVLAGALPRRALSHVLEWLDKHKSELEANWVRARNRDALQRIEPLE